MSFERFGLNPLILRNVKDSGYEDPTPIQRETIPLVMQGRDVLGCAQTGTGKTAAFALPILHQLAAHPVRPGQPRVIRVLVLTPTRELAMQIYENFVQYGKKLPIFPAVIFGGVNQNGQVEALHRGADVVIACPGRLWDLMNQGYVRLDWVETFVLDEADRMLDMGFIHDVRRIAAKLPQKRQTLMFSATMPEEVEKLALDLLDHPAQVKVDPVSSTVEAIRQTLYYVDKANKKHLLAQILRSEEVENCLVFSRTRHGADKIVRELKREGIECCAIHGDKSQAARQAALNSFKNGECKVLIATDIAARGIDIAGLSHVVNYDMPMEPEAYVHRIGRTGRAGRDGNAISFCCIDEMKQLHQVEKLIGKRIPLRESDWPMLVTTPSEPKERTPRPERVAKVNSRGEAVALKKPAPRAAAPAAPKAAPAHTAPLPGSGQPIIIGRDGKVSVASAGKPAHTGRAPQASAPKKQQPPKGGKQQGAAHAALAKPVQRVNRHRNKG